MTELSHHTRNIRISPRKLRLVVDKVRHLSAEKALAMLPLVEKGGAIHVQKSLKAAIAAAADKDLSAESLVIQRIWADEGTALKRIITRSRGRSTGIMKKYSHLTIVLKGDTATRAPKRASKKVESIPAESVVEEEN